MKAFLTGIDGFAGSHLADRLVEDGEEVSGLVVPVVGEGPRERLSRIIDRIRLEPGDIRDQKLLAALFREIKPDVVYHLAAVASVQEASGAPDEAFSVNFHGTASICGALLDSGVDAEVFVITSGEVYGDQPGPHRETAPLRPANPYSVSKAAADLLAFQQFYQRGLRTVRLRPFNHVGPRQDPSFVCSDFARQIAEIEAGRRPPAISVGNLDSVRDFLSVRDVVEAYRLAPGRLEHGEAYNVASGTGRTIAEILELLLGMTEVKIEVKQESSRRRRGDVPEMVGDATRFQEATGWVPSHPLEEAIAALLKEWRTRMKRS
ncbi:MAG: GDP-mannose 4,6-dehydratase [Planctomycetota bacterium]|nr:GDP-mannose 4,6-dehydratase [Planctomycetota bacterium]